MKVLLTTNDLVTISFAEALLKDSDLGYFILDQNMSIMEGSIGVIPRRIMVADDDLGTARKLLEDAGLGKEMSQ